MYFKETQTPSEKWSEGPGQFDKRKGGQIHFFPAICNVAQARAPPRAPARPQRVLCKAARCGRSSTSCSSPRGCPPSATTPSRRAGRAAQVVAPLWPGVRE